MKVTRKYVLLAVAVLALVALWYMNRQKIFAEAFENEAANPRKNIEKFNTVQKEMACKSFEEQIKMYEEMVKKGGSTEEEKKMLTEVAKTVESLKAEQAKMGC